MGVTAERKKNRIARAVTLGINLIQDEFLWKLFSDSPVGSDESDEDRFYRLTIFEFALAKTVGSDTKDFRYMKEEPLKSAVYYATSGVDIDINALISMLRSHCDMFRLNPGQITEMYKEVVSIFVSRRFLMALAALCAVTKRLCELFNSGKQISAEEIASFTSNHINLIKDELDKDEAAWLSEMTGMKEERAREVIDSTRTKIENYRAREEPAIKNVRPDIESEEE